MSQPVITEYLLFSMWTNGLSMNVCKDIILAICWPIDRFDCFYLADEMEVSTIHVKYDIWFPHGRAVVWLLDRAAYSCKSAVRDE